VWQHPESVAGGMLPQRNCPAVDLEGHRVFACVQNKLVAFLDENGQYRQLWEYDTGGHIPGSPAIGPDGNVRIHSGDGLLHIVQTSGEPSCDPVEIGEPLGWASPVVDDENATWICACNGGLLRIDPQGQKGDRPYFRSREKFDCTGLIYNSVFYVGGNNSCVYAIPLNEERAANRWDHLNEQGRTGWFINSAPALAGGPILIVASRDDHIYAFDLDGNRLWNEPMPGQMLGSPVVDDGNNVYVGLSVSHRGEDARGMLVRIDGTSHRIRWRYDTDSPVESTPVIGADGVIYFGDNGGTIHAVDKNGQPKWTEPVDAPVRSAGTVVGKGRVAFGLDDGRLVAVRCSSEEVLQSGWPKYMGAPEQSGMAAPPAK